MRARSHARQPGAYSRASSASVQASVEKAAAALGGLDILVNNAGILRLSEVKDISLEDIDALLHINIRAPIIASKAAIPHLGDNGGANA